MEYPRESILKLNNYKTADKTIKLNYFSLINSIIIHSKKDLEFEINDIENNFKSYNLKLESIKKLNELDFEYNFSLLLFCKNINIKSSSTIKYLNLNGIKLNLNINKNLLEYFLNLNIIIKNNQNNTSSLFLNNRIIELLIKNKKLIQAKEFLEKIKNSELNYKIIYKIVIFKKFFDFNINQIFDYIKNFKNYILIFKLLKVILQFKLQSNLIDYTFFKKLFKFLNIYFEDKYKETFIFKLKLEKCLLDDIKNSIVRENNDFKLNDKLYQNDNDYEINLITKILNIIINNIDKIKNKFLNYAIDFITSNEIIINFQINFSIINLLYKFIISSFIKLKGDYKYDENWISIILQWKSIFDKGSYIESKVLAFNELKNNNLFTKEELKCVYLYYFKNKYIINFNNLFNEIYNKYISNYICEINNFNDIFIFLNNKIKEVKNKLKNSFQWNYKIIKITENQIKLSETIDPNIEIIKDKVDIIKNNFYQNNLNLFMNYENLIDILKNIIEKINIKNENLVKIKNSIISNLKQLLELFLLDTLYLNYYRINFFIIVSLYEVYNCYDDLYEFFIYYKNVFYFILNNNINKDDLNLIMIDFVNLINKLNKKIEEKFFIEIFKKLIEYDLEHNDNLLILKKWCIKNFNLEKNINYLILVLLEGDINKNYNIFCDKKFINIDILSKLNKFIIFDEYFFLKNKWKNLAKDKFKIKIKHKENNILKIINIFKNLVNKITIHQLNQIILQIYEKNKNTIFGNLIYFLKENIFNNDIFDLILILIKKGINFRLLENQKILLIKLVIKIFNEFFENKEFIIFLIKAGFLLFKFLLKKIPYQKESLLIGESSKNNLLNLNTLKLDKNYLNYRGIISIKFLKFINIIINKYYSVNLFNNIKNILYELVPNMINLYDKNLKKDYFKLFKNIIINLIKYDEFKIIIWGLKLLSNFLGIQFFKNKLFKNNQYFSKHIKIIDDEIIEKLENLYNHWNFKVSFCSKAILKFYFFFIKYKKNKAIIKNEIYEKSNINIEDIKFLTIDKTFEVLWKEELKFLNLFEKTKNDNKIENINSNISISSKKTTIKKKSIKNSKNKSLTNNKKSDKLFFNKKCIIISNK